MYRYSSLRTKLSFIDVIGTKYTRPKTEKCFKKAYRFIALLNFARNSNILKDAQW